MKNLLIVSAFVLSTFMVGCGSSGDAGDVEKAQAASAAAPKSTADLSADMPDNAKRGAAAAIQQNQAQKEQMDAQAQAMRQAREGRR